MRRSFAFDWTTAHIAEDGCLHVQMTSPVRQEAVYTKAKIDAHLRACLLHERKERRPHPLTGAWKTLAAQWNAHAGSLPAPSPPPRRARRGSRLSLSPRPEDPFQNMPESDVPRMGLAALVADLSSEATIALLHDIERERRLSLRDLKELVEHDRDKRDRQLVVCKALKAAARIRVKMAKA